MILARQAGRTVRGTLDPGQAGQRWAATRWLHDAGVGLFLPRRRRPFRKLHHKLMVVDDATVVAGSFNYTVPANDYNDENLFVLGSPYPDLPADEGGPVDPDRCAELTAFFRAEIDRIIAVSRRTGRADRWAWLVPTRAGARALPLPSMRFLEIAEASEAVAGASARLAKVDRLAACLRRLAPHEVEAAVAYLSGELRQRQIGVGWAALRDLPAPATQASLDVAEVDETLDLVGRQAGPGSQRERRRLLNALFEKGTPVEQRFLAALLGGELRQGALGGVMVEAVARAADVPSAEVRRALMLHGSLGAVAAVALTRGADGLRGFRLEVGRAVQPMLAQTAANIGDALDRIQPAAVEWKLDGARIQIHRRDGDVRVFTRTLDDITARVPEVVAAVLALPVRSVVLDGEAIALRADGRPRPFQVTAGRLGSKLDVAGGRASVPLTPFLFDLLHLDGDDLIDLPGADRHAALAAVTGPELRVPRTTAADADDAERFLGGALDQGHEGVMVKSLAAPYEAGRRGAGWLKVKPVHTLDLVVLAAEWGHGRRRGWLSNLHLGARDPAGGFVMLGKTFKGMTDELLGWQTERLRALEVGREGHIVHVRPELVVEIAFDGVQTSSRYPGGVTLRFARVVRYRPDKRAHDADTVEAVRTLLG